ncbi:fibronectin-binding domain-containing protein [Candidatus Thorarchaeota archaeon]|nr:MAG: fibronectin-binding domain-containing protein [Candidatus Thorarchaeota archaeon]
MKDTMSNVDIRLILPEIKEVAEGAFIKNIYQYGDVFVLKLYKPGIGTTQLLIEPGKRIHLTDYRRVAPRFPSKFCSVLRKYLRDRVISSFEQYDLDRIVIIEVGDDENSYKLVAELFGNGNLLLLDPDDVIFVAKQYKKMRHRDLVPKAKYEFPPLRGRDILSEDRISAEELVEGSEKNIVRTLIYGLNLDSLSCEEVCELANIEGTTKASELNEDGLNSLNQAIARFAEKVENGVKEPRIVLDEEEEAIAFLPFEFQVYDELKHEEYETYSRAIDEFYGVTIGEEERAEEEDAFQREKKRLQKIIEKQEESMEQLEEKAETMRKHGELIYANFPHIQEILRTISQARDDGISWDEIERRMQKGREQGIESAKMIESISPSQGKILLKLNDEDVSLDIRMSPQDNAARAYEQAKKAESKVRGAKKQIEKTEEKLRNLEESFEPEPEEKRPVKVRERKWFEKFRWFRSSEGYLVLGGRDSRTNERLAKRHMNPNDVFLHASLHGAPYTVIKVPDDPPSEKTLREAAQFSVTFSRAWREGILTGDAYWVDPEQVSFSPPSGEYLPSGAVMIYGNKNFIRNVAVELAVGLIADDDGILPMSGPPSAVETQCDYFVRVAPGDVKKGDLVGRIQYLLEKQVPEDDQYLVRQVTQEDIMRVLPPGDGKVIE